MYLRRADARCGWLLADRQRGSGVLVEETVISLAVKWRLTVKPPGELGQAREAGAGPCVAHMAGHAVMYSPAVPCAGPRR